MKCVYWLQLNTKTLCPISRHSLMSQVLLYGKFIDLNAHHSIVMEYADNGDVFQKICEHQTAGSFMKEKIVWKVLI
jgi:serine/threonine protein kinase